MKYINFKRYKFPTIFRHINLRRYKFSTIFRHINLKRYRFHNILRNINLRRYSVSNIFRNINLSGYNFSKIGKLFNIKNFRYILSYISVFIFCSAVIYLSIPIFYNYDKLTIAKIICKDFNISCTIKNKINYSFFPSPRIKIRNLIIKDFSDEKKILGKINNLAIKLSPYNLLNKKKFNYTKIELKNSVINIDFNDFKNYKNFSKKNIGLKTINLKKGTINFLEGNKSIIVLKEASAKYNSSTNIDKFILKGNFLGDKIDVNFQNKKTPEDSKKVITLKFLDSKLFTKITIFSSILEKKTNSGNILFKKDKNRLTAIFDYMDDKIIIKKANLKNSFLDGKFSGEVKFLPYFDFNLDLHLNNIYFTRLYNSLIKLDDLDRKNLFKINKKINGQLSLYTEKIYSKYNLIDSFETRIKFTNGDILVNQLLLNLGKLGAADISGYIKADEKFTNFNFEKNIFIDNPKYFYNRFGILNKQNILSNLFVSGKLDLVNLNLRLNEISNDKKFREEDTIYVEREFNNILLVEGYSSFFDYSRLKAFIKLVINEIN